MGANLGGRVQEGPDCRQCFRLVEHWSVADSRHDDFLHSGSRFAHPSRYVGVDDVGQAAANEESRPAAGQPAEQQPGEQFDGLARLAQRRAMAGS